jgi:hypothetical protein
LLVVGVLATRVWLADMSGSGAWVAVVADVHQETKGAYRRLLHFLAEKDDRHVRQSIQKNPIVFFYEPLDTSP